MRANVSLRLLHVLAIAALLSGLLAVLAPGLPVRLAFAAPAAQQSGCVVGTNLVSNGGFETTGGGTAIGPPWTTSGTTRTLFLSQYAYDGTQYALLGGNASITQQLPTSGLRGATLRVALAAGDVDPGTATVTLGGTTLGTVTGSDNRLRYFTLDTTYTVPRGTASVPLTITAGASGIVVDAVSVTVVACGPDTAPVATNQFVTTNEDTAATITLGVSDADGDPLTAITITDQPDHGTLSGSNVAAGTITYTPDANYNGADSFRYTVTANGQTSNEATVSITVTRVNDAPVAQNDAFTTNEDTPLPITAAQLLANDTDADAGETATLRVRNVTQPAHGTLSGNANNGFTYTPNRDYAGPDSFTYTANDGTTNSNVATVTLTVNAVDDAPVAADQSVTTAEDTALRITLSATDNDTRNRDLTYAYGQPAHGRVTGSGATVRYTPDQDYTGSDSFTFTASDATSTSAPATVSITVTPVNDAPVIDDTTVPADRTVEATGSDGAVVTFTTPLASDPDGTTPTVSCDPASGSTFPLGETTVTCTASDGTLSDTATFTVTVIDTTAPVVNEETVPGTGTPRVLTVEATGSSTTVRWDPVTATDAVDGTVTLDCRIDADGDPATLPTGDVIGASGTTFPVGDTLVTCVGMDGSDNTATTSFVVRVVDTTAPVLTVPANITAEATSSAGAVVTYTATATDLVDGSVTPVCTPASGSTFPIGTTTVSCTATDAAGNISAAKTFTITVRDTTGPTITFVGGPQPNQTYTQATLPAEPTCTATDTSSSVVQCRVYGYSTAPGTHTLTARARDAQGNASVSTRTYTVTASAPTATPRPATATPRPATATPQPATATPVPAQPTAIPTRAPRPTATPVTPSAPTTAPSRAPRG